MDLKIDPKIDFGDYSRKLHDTIGYLAAYSEHIRACGSIDIAIELVKDKMPEILPGLQTAQLILNSQKHAFANQYGNTKRT